MTNSEVNTQNSGSTLKIIRRPPGSVTDRVAVVFIHGFGGDWQSTWQDFPNFLVAEPQLADWDICSLGYDSHLRIDMIKLWSADPDLQKVALKLTTDVRAGALEQYRSLVLIAHSMGGLVTQRALLDSAELCKRVSHVFLFGTPSGGLAKASLARWLKPQLRDMSKKGEFILKLRAEWDKQFSHVRGKSLPFMLSVVAGLRDEFVPSESSLDPFPMNVRFVVPGNHLEIVKPSAADHESVQLVVNRLVGNAAPEGPWNAARVAIESRDFYHAINLLETREAELDPEGLVQLALSLEGVGRQDDAIAVLARHGTSGTDAMGVLAGRLKRRWLLSHGAGDAASARKYYAEALAQALTAEDYAQAYYHAINIAFFQLFADKNRVTARATAEQVLEFCAKAKLEELAGDRKWRLATEGEALLHLGRTDEAYQRYRQAVEQYVTPREVESMYRQAIYLSRGIGDEAMRRELTRIFRHEESP